MADQRLGELLQMGVVIPRRFDTCSPSLFLNKAVLEETRRAYRKVMADFFQFLGEKLLAEVVPGDVVRWLDHLQHGRDEGCHDLL